MNEHATARRRRAFVFRYRGALLAAPALALAAFGRPSAFSIATGLPLAFAGELLRCWAVGYSGATTRGDRVEAPGLATGGPYAYVRNPLYLGNAVTALGFALAFAGGRAGAARAALVGGGLATMAAVYATIVPHEEEYLASRFGASYAAYRAAVPPWLPRRAPHAEAAGVYDPGVIAAAESRTFVSLGVMLVLLAAKARARRA